MDRKNRAAADVLPRMKWRGQMIRERTLVAVGLPTRPPFDPAQQLPGNRVSGTGNSTPVVQVISRNCRR
jgi:hypothetical protein